MKVGEQRLVGRESELARLAAGIDGAIACNGSATVVSGEPGIGKSMLVAELARRAADKGLMVLKGAAAAESAIPFLMFSKAVGESIGGGENVQFSHVLVAGREGSLIAKAGTDELGVAFAAVLSAVQAFVKDSFGESGPGLGSLECGGAIVLIEHTESFLIAAVFKGAEHPEMRERLRASARRVENILRPGAMSSREGADASEAELAGLLSVKFPVRRDMEASRLEGERLRIAESLMERLSRKASEGALMLVLEDLHWADESSLFTLMHIARNLHGRRIFIVGTMRPGECAKLEGTLERMRGEGSVCEVSLGRLAADDVSALARSLYEPNDFDAEFLRQLADQCSGNPLFVLEMLKQMRSCGSIEPRNGVYSLLNRSYAVPESIEGIVESRLATLEPDALAVAEYAACIGREFDISAARSLKSLGNPAESFAKLCSSGIVKEGNGAAEFIHALFQDVLYKSLEIRWKSAYHKSLGEYYEESRGNDMDRYVYELARHFWLAGSDEKAAGYCAMAGAKSEAALAYEQAAEYLGQAAEAAGKLPRTPESEARVAALLERRGDCLSVLGLFDAALSTYGAASETGAVASRPRARRKMAYVLLSKGEYSKALELADALAEERASDVEMIRILEVRSGIYINTDRYEMAMADLERALALARNDKPLQALVLSGMGRALERNYRLKEALEAHMRGLALAEEAGDTESILKNHGSIGVVQKMLGNHDDAIEHLRKAIEIATTTKNVFRLGAAYLNLGTVFFRKADFARAEENLLKGIDIQRRIGNKQGLANGLNNLGNLYDEMGRHGESMALHRESLQLKEGMGDLFGQATSHHGLGFILRKLGRFDEAEKSFNRCLELLEKAGKHGATIQPLGALSVLYSEMLDFERATGFAERSLELARKSESKSEVAGAMLRKGIVLSGVDLARAMETLRSAISLSGEIDEDVPVAEGARALALCELESGLPAEALAHAAGSLKAFDALGLPFESSRSRMVLGAALGASGRLPEGIAELQRAREAFARFSAPFEVAQSELYMAILLRGSDADESREYAMKARRAFASLGLDRWTERCTRAVLSTVGAVSKGG